MTALSKVVLARPGEEAAVFDFFCMSHTDNGVFPLSSRKTIDMIMRAIKCQNGIEVDGTQATIGIIKDEKGKIEAASGMVLENSWYSDYWFIGELLNYVHVDHRRSKHAQALLAFQKDFSDKMSAALGQKVPLVSSILTMSRLEPKMRFFQRYMPQVGAIFAHNFDDLVPKSEFHNQRKLEAPRKELKAVDA